MKAHGTPTPPREDRGPGSISIVINEGSAHDRSANRSPRAPGAGAAGAVARMVRGMRGLHREPAFA